MNIKCELDARTKRSYGIELLTDDDPRANFYESAHGCYVCVQG